MRPFLLVRMTVDLPDELCRELKAMAVRRECQLRGTPLNTVDGMIAATGLEHDLTLVTRNMKDFGGLGVTVFKTLGCCISRPAARACRRRLPLSYTCPRVLLASVDGATVVGLASLLTNSSSVCDNDN
jgi:hypothetical protein